MDMREWLSLIFIIGIVLILLDGFRRKWQERRRSLRIKLDKSIPPGSGQHEENNGELPNGGARVVGSKKVPYYGSAGSSGFEAEEQAQFNEESNLDEEDGEDEYDFRQSDERVYSAQEQVVNSSSLEQDDDFDEIVPVLVNEVDLELDEEAAEAEEYQSHVDSQEAEATEQDAEAGVDEEEYSPDSQTPLRGERIEPSFSQDYENDFSEDGAFDEDRDFDETYNNTPMVAEKRETAASVSYTKADQAELFVDKNAEKDQNEGEPESAPEVQEVIVLNVMAKSGEVFSGKDLLPILMKQGMRLGDMSIFHRHADSNGNGPVMFSMANMVEPGTFDISQMEEFTSPGIGFFLQMPNPLGNMKSFDKMLDAATAVKEGLKGDLKDEDRNLITRQTIEHSREKIRDFELKQLSAK